MGNCQSYSPHFKGIIISKGYEKWSPIFTAMKISKSDLFKLYTAYEDFDVDHHGTIDVHEFLETIEIEYTPFTRRIFSIFDKDSSDEIDFFEFVGTIWNYCTLSRFTLGKLYT